MAETNRTCTGCKKTLPENDFYKSYNNVRGKYYFKPKCKPCTNAENVERARNSKRCQDYQRKYRLENKERINAQTKQWIADNKERVRSANSANYYANCEKRKQGVAAWRRENAGLALSYMAKNRADRKQRYPIWANDSEIQRIYALRQSMSDYFKTDFHVDHIVPLKGRKVSGLHVHNNLQILTAEQNLSKGNKFKCK